MFGFLIKLTVLFGIVFGIVYGLVRAARSAQQKRVLSELEEAKRVGNALAAQIAALKAALDEGDITKREHDDLARAILERCKEEGVPIDDLAGGDETEAKRRTR